MKKRLLMNQKGATAIEFAIVLPILLVLMFGIIEFSVILYNKAMVTSASREGGRAGIVYRYNPTLKQENRLTEGEISDVVTSFLENRLINFRGNPNAFSVNAPNAQGISGSYLVVDVAYQHDMLVLPNFVRNLAGGLDLSARTRMRME